MYMSYVEKTSLHYQNNDDNLNIFLLFATRSTEKRSKLEGIYHKMVYIVKTVPGDQCISVKICVKGWGVTQVTQWV